MANQALKYAAAGVLIGSLFYLVLTGKIQASDYQTLATTALGALGGFHAGASRQSPDHIGDPTQMVTADTYPNHNPDAGKMVATNPTQPPKEG